MWRVENNILFYNENLVAFDGVFTYFFVVVVVLVVLVVLVLVVFIILLLIFAAEFRLLLEVGIFTSPPRSKHSGYTKYRQISLRK
jgi:hypothetical protein